MAALEGLALAAGRPGAGASSGRHAGSLGLACRPDGAPAGAGPGVEPPRGIGPVAAKPQGSPGDDRAGPVAGVADRPILGTEPGAARPDAGGPPPRAGGECA